MTMSALPLYLFVPSSATAMTIPSRAFTSSMLPHIFSCVGPTGAMTTTGMLLVDERDRAVLHLARRVALRMDVGDLLELERALQRQREMQAPAEIEQVLALGERASPAARISSLRSTSPPISSGTSHSALAACWRSAGSTRRRAAAKPEREQGDRA